MGNRRTCFSVLWKRKYCLGLMLAACLGSGSAISQTKDASEAYPSRPIRLIVGFPPGGSTDLIARSLGNVMSARLGQQVVVDNRAGGGGGIAYETTSRAAADGHTIALAISGLVTGPIINPKLAFDSVKDFTPIALVATSPYSVIVHPSVPAKSIQEFRKYAASVPRQLNYGSSGHGGGSHLAIELFKILTGLDIVHVPYKGTGPAITDLIANRIQMMFAGAISSLPHVKANRVRVLAVTGSARSAVLPDVPTLTETILPGFDAAEWFGMVGPAKMPGPLVSRLNREILSAMTNPNFREQISNGGATVAVGTPAEFSKFIAAEKEKWSTVVTKAKITPE